MKLLKLKNIIISFFKIIIDKLSFLFLVLALILLLIISAKLNFSFLNINRYFYFYIIIFLILIFFSILSSLSNRIIRIYLIIIATSCFFTMIFFEAYLWYQNFYKVRLQSKTKIHYELNKKKYEEKTEIQKYTELKNKDFTITIPPSVHVNNKIEMYPLSGISNKKTIFCNNGSYIIYKSDRYGFNNPDEEWNNLSTEYFLIGDSFVHGKCVDKRNDISSILRNLTKKSLINVSYSGNGPLIEYATLKEYLPKNTKNVLWFFYEGNDLEDMGNELKSNILRKYFLDKNYIQNLKFKQNEIDIFLNTYVEEIYLKKLKNIDNNKIKSFFSLFKFSNLQNFFLTFIGQYGFLKSDYSKFKKLAFMINDFVKQNNSKLYFIYLPEYQRYTFLYNNSNYLKIREIITGLDIPFIDIHKSIFQNEINPLTLFPNNYDDNHYNELGYRKISEEIIKNIR